MAALDSLDNPVWHALNTHHRHLAIRCNTAVRYEPDTFLVAGVPDGGAPAFRDLESIVEAGKTIALFGTSPLESLEGWEVLRAGHIPQMVFEDLKPSRPVDAVELTADDVPEMLNLVSLAKPGPFLNQTIRMGRYFGLRRDGRLAAMAGQRLHLTGFREISAVCTHPEYRGRGYAGALTTVVAKHILACQETPFLHLAPTNDVARRLYEKLGFRKRTEISLTVLRKPA